METVDTFILIHPRLGYKVEEVLLQRSSSRTCPLLNDNWREDEQAEWNYNYDSDVLVRMLTPGSDLSIITSPSSPAAGLHL